MRCADYDTITRYSEMTPEDHSFILDQLQKANPRKVLEVGVCAGGTTNFLLRVLPATATVYSVDIETKYPRDPTKNTGFVAEDDYDPSSQARWVKYFGHDAASCVEEIGHGIDFAILDTTHLLPGEILTFLTILPFMNDTSVLVLHDIATHMIHKLASDDVASPTKNEFCTPLLFNAVASGDKSVSEASVPNCGAVTLCRDNVMNNIFMVLNMLFLDWQYIPSPKILGDVLRVVRRYYTARDAAFLERAIQYSIAQAAKEKRTGTK